MRDRRGTTLFLVLCLSAVIVIPIAALGIAIWIFGLHSQKAQSVVEAAAKVGAMDLSRIVLNDPSFGYVSLSNHPAVGTLTVDRSGSSLPITGMPTLLGTINQCKAVGDKLGNDTIKALADQDYDFAQDTVRSLNMTLETAVSDYPRGCFDMNGKRVEVLQDVRDFLEANLPPTVSLKSLTVSLGWYDEPMDRAKNPIPAEAAFRLDPQAHLVSAANFREPDGKHLCSVIKVECSLMTRDGKNTPIECMTCCQAYSERDSSPGGAMTVRFPGRPVPGLLTWNEFLSNQSFNDHKVTRFDVLDGDYPVEREAHLKQSGTTIGHGSADEFASHLYYWLRNGHERPKTEAILAMMNEPFRPYSNQVYRYRIEDDGSIKREVLDGDPAKSAIVADGQIVSMADMQVRSGACAIAMFRDNVQFLSTERGKHAGQPIDGVALDIEIGGTRDSTAQEDVIAMRRRTAMRRI